MIILIGTCAVLSGLMIRAIVKNSQAVVVEGRDFYDDNQTIGLVGLVLALVCKAINS